MKSETYVRLFAHAVCGRGRMLDLAKSSIDNQVETFLKAFLTTFIGVCCPSPVSCLTLQTYIYTSSKHAHTSVAFAARVRAALPKALFSCILGWAGPNPPRVPTSG